MTKRIITIVCEVDQPDVNWIWEQHISVTGIPVHGVIRVEAIINGDQLEVLEKEVKYLQRRIDYLEQWFGA